MWTRKIPNTDIFTQWKRSKIIQWSQITCTISNKKLRKQTLHRLCIWVASLTRKCKVSEIWNNWIRTRPIFNYLSKLAKSWSRGGRNYLYSSLSNSRRHSANAEVIADVKSKIIVSCWHFFADVIFSATSKIQNYQNKTGEKSLYPSKYVLTTYFKEFYGYFQIYILYSLSLANCKQVKKCNRLYQSSLSAMFFFNRY